MTDTEAKKFYAFNLAGKSPTEIADMIVVWREDEEDDEPMGHAFDLLNAIEPYLRGQK